MAFTDTALTDAYVHPQGGSASGVSDNDADWLNSVYLGAGYLAPGGDVAPYGYDVTVDFAAGDITVSGGVAYLERDSTLPFREPQDTVLTRNGSWNQPFLAFIYMATSITVSVQTPGTTNYVWLYFTESSQNDAYIRVADSSADEPSNPSLLIEEIDDGSNSQAPQNRVAGYSWDYLGKQSTNGLVTEATVNIPDQTYDEYKIKHIKVSGDGTSSTEFQATVNGHTANYWYRTTQGNTTGSSYVKVGQANPSDAYFNGQLYCSVKNRWTFDNRIAGSHGKQYAFTGSNKSPADTTPMNTIEFSWASGSIDGEWNIWARNTL